MAAAGKVSTQATRMLPATPHRTADRRFVAPTPMIAEVIVCVVEIGSPNPAAVNSTADAVLSAAKPSGGPRSITLRPSVRMMRQPPAYVPAESTAAVSR